MATKKVNKFYVALSAVFLAALVCMGLWFVFYKTASKPQCVVVSGISSSGKSTTVDVLARLLGDDCAVVRLDDFIQKIVETKARQLSWTEQNPMAPLEFLRAHVEQSSTNAVFDYEIRAHLLDYSLFYDAVRAALKAQKYVLIDTVVESERCRQELQAVISGFNPLWVLLYCPLNIIEKRLRERSNMASFANNEISLATYESFLAMYTPDKKAHWTALDALHPLATRVLLDSSVNSFLQRVTYDQVIGVKERLYGFRKRFLQHFGLAQKHSDVQIYPAQRYDLVIKTATTPSEVVAQEIKLALEV